MTARNLATLSQLRSIHEISKFNPPVNHSILPNLPNISANHSQTGKKTKCMVARLSISLNVGCLTSVKLPFTLTALTFGSWLHCANVSYFNG